METINFYGHFYVEHTNGTRVRVVYKDDCGLTIGVRNIKEHPDMSDETTCFSATVDLNGRTAGYASNDGRGGCSCVNFHDRKDWERFQEISKPDGFLCKEDIIDWVVNLTLDFKDNMKGGNKSLLLLMKRYPKTGLW